MEELYTPEQAEAMQKNIMKFHLRKLGFAPTEKHGVSGIDVQMEDTIKGLITHFDYAVNYSTVVAIRPFAPFLNALSDLMRSRPAPEILTYLQENLPNIIYQWNDVNTSCSENIGLLTKELDDQGWTDDMM